MTAPSDRASGAEQQQLMLAVQCGHLSRLPSVGKGERRKAAGDCFVVAIVHPEMRTASVMKASFEGYINTAQRATALQVS